MIKYTELKKRIKKHEGFRNKVYLDQLGHPTIGYGHLVKKNDKIVIKKKYSKKHLISLLRKRLVKAKWSILEQEIKPLISQCDKDRMGWESLQYIQKTMLLADLYFELILDSSTASQRQLCSGRDAASNCGQGQKRSQIRARDS